MFPTDEISTPSRRRPLRLLKAARLLGVLLVVSFPLHRPLYLLATGQLPPAAERDDREGHAEAGPGVPRPALEVQRLERDADERDRRTEVRGEAVEVFKSFCRHVDPLHLVAVAFFLCFVLGTMRAARIGAEMKAEREAEREARERVEQRRREIAARLEELERRTHRWG